MNSKQSISDINATNLKYGLSRAFFRLMNGETEHVAELTAALFELTHKSGKLEKY